MHWQAMQQIANVTDAMLMVIQQIYAESKLLLQALDSMIMATITMAITKIRIMEKTTVTATAETTTITMAKIMVIAAITMATTTPTTTIATTMVTTAKTTTATTMAANETITTVETATTTEIATNQILIKIAEIHLINTTTVQTMIHPNKRNSTVATHQTFQTKSHTVDLTPNMEKRQTQLLLNRI